jgi:hypothetical protein
MKRIPHILIILTLLLSAAPSLAYGQAGPNNPNLPNNLFLPLVGSGPGPLSVSGKVVDHNNQPLANVQIVDGLGNSTSTDSKGQYTLSGLSGDTFAVAPSKPGLVFSPSMLSGKLSNPVTGQDFTGITACTDVMVNGGFESDTGWVFPATPFTAGYSTDLFHTGVRSARTGILKASQNIYSYSSARTQEITIPSDATSVNLRLWLYPISSEPPSAVVQDVPVGMKADSIALASDSQYVLVLKPGASGNLEDDTVLKNLLGVRRNTQAWTFYDFNLTEFAGKTIKIQAGTYNDGFGGVTAMYVDDVTLEVCNGGSVPSPTPTPAPSPTPPPPGVCSERISNNSFETISSWYIPITVFSAGYSTDLAHTGVSSMRTGIVYAPHNRFSYSDAGQQVTIPSGNTTAILGLWEYSTSGATSLLALPPPEPTGKPFGVQAVGNDLQYVLILDVFGNWIDTLLWQRSNAQLWTFHQYDISKYIGRTIKIQFGTYNDGLDGITSMYVDDVSLQACP